MTSAKKQVASDSAQYCVIAAPFGGLGILTELVDGSLMLSRIEYLPATTALVSPKNQLARDAEKQFKAYFQNPHHPFDLPIFLQRVVVQRCPLEYIGLVCFQQILYHQKMFEYEPLPLLSNFYLKLDELEKRYDQEP